MPQAASGTMNITGTKALAYYNAPATHKSYKAQSEASEVDHKEYAIP